MTVPERPRLYHIVHVDRLSSIVSDGYLWCDEEIARRSPEGTIIGMHAIKERRLTRCRLASHPGLFVGQCVPFYFCPRSVMLYVIYCRNHEELEYKGGQNPIVHLEADLFDTVAWAGENGKRWAFTLSNAGSTYFEDHCDLAQLKEINWEAVEAIRWSGDISCSVKEGKQAEFLVEHSFPWQLVSRIGVYSMGIANQARRALGDNIHRPDIEIVKAWYY